MATHPVLDSAPPAEFLGADEFVCHTDPAVRALAAELRRGSDGDVAFARAAYEWVRDEVAHSVDARDPRVTATAAEVLEHRVGLCYAKSHLLAALLRAEGVPAGLCYQRLAHGDGYVLHGLVAVHLEDAWHRLDPRGNTGNIDAQFALGEERLAWAVDPTLGEIDCPRIFGVPARSVVDALGGTDDVLSLCDAGLPTDCG